MRFSILLSGLYLVLKTASLINRDYKRHLRNVSAKIMIKTEGDRRGRLFIFDRGKVSSRRGARQPYDVALVWKDAATGFSVMTNRAKDASFNAAATGGLKVLGMSVFAQWFEDGVNLVL